MPIISKVEVHLFRIERKKEILPKTSHGTTTHNEYVILEIYTKSGVVGIGEVTCALGWNGEEGVGTADILKRKIAPDLIGKDISNWLEISSVIEPSVRHRPFLRAGIEMACLDAEGKLREMPVAQLLGGIRRSEFATKLVLPSREAEVVRGMAKIALDRGGTAFKVKVGLNLQADRARLAAVRDVIGGARLYVDANEGWRPDEEPLILDLIDDFNILAVEQPYPRRMVAESAELQAKTSALLMADESVWTTNDVINIAANKSFKVVSLYPGKQGGIRACLEAATLATNLGLGVCLGSNLETGVGSAAMAHFLAVAPALCKQIPGDLLGPLYFESDITTDTSWVKWTGASLPTGPGLGVELDHGVLDSLRISVTV